jgi:hypothetical protein
VSAEEKVFISIKRFFATKFLLPLAFLFKEGKGDG